MKPSIGAIGSIGESVTSTDNEADIVLLVYEPSLGYYRRYHVSEYDHEDMQIALAIIRSVHAKLQG